MYEVILHNPRKCPEAFFETWFSVLFQKFCSLLTAIFLLFGEQHLLFIFYSVILSCYYYELF